MGKNKQKISSFWKETSVGKHVPNYTIQIAVSWSDPVCK